LRRSQFDPLLAIVCAFLPGSVVALLALDGMAQTAPPTCDAAYSSLDVRRVPVLDVAWVPCTQPYTRRGAFNDDLGTGSIPRRLFGAKARSSMSARRARRLGLTALRAFSDAVPDQIQPPYQSLSTP
jgi:hypothetical protein